MNTLSDILLQRARVEPDSVAYRFFQGAALECESVTYGELAQSACALAARFQQAAQPQSRFLLACKSQQQFVLAFYACMLAGMVAVPTAVPRRKALAERLGLLVRDADVCAVVYDSDDVVPAELDAGGAPLLAFDLRTIEAEAREFAAPQLAATDIAFLQYTSGSTGDPKGVVVTHANLMHNSAVIQEAMRISRASAVFTALPMFHDMGLVGGLLQPMFSGCVGHWMTPAEFVQYPERWMQIMSRYRITISGGPNFMYELAARSITPEQLAGVELSHWQIAFCGAEPIRASTMAGFIDLFGPYGFKATSFYPCYGMAESTLFISGKADGVAPQVCSEHGSEVVCCGVPRQDTGIHIVDPDSAQPLPERAVGEIWISGRSVARGYWRRPELSERSFKAALAGHQGAFLRTGDLGYLKDGQLYVTGRLKDLLIVYGKKYAPQDIENQAEGSHTGLREAGGAAFSVPGKGSGADAVVLVFELKREWLRRQQELPAVAAAIRQSVRAGYDLALDDVVFIKPGALPRTSSGKVMRAQCRNDYLAGDLERVSLAA